MPVVGGRDLTLLRSYCPPVEGFTTLVVIYIIAVLVVLVVRTQVMNRLPDKVRHWTAVPLHCSSWLAMPVNSTTSGDVSEGKG